MKTIDQIEWPQELREKMDKLADRLYELGSFIVAFSAGVDSTFLAVVASQLPGVNVLAVTADSPSVPRSELDEAVQLVKDFNIPHQIVQTREFDVPEYIQNPENRCYYCKTELFGTLVKLAKESGYAGVLDGANADDRGDYRPGSDAAREQGVFSPLQELDFTKDDIRTASRIMGLPTADKPAYACLSSRIPHGFSVTPEALAAVENAEKGLHEMGFKQCRVRVHGDVARLELESSEIARAASNEYRVKIADLLIACGFKFPALDLVGYSQGRLNAQNAS